MATAVPKRLCVWITQFKSGEDMSSPGQVPTAPANLVYAARVRPAVKDAFIEWNGRGHRRAARVAGIHGPRGHPATVGQRRPWVFVTHFDSLPHLDAWRTSAARRQLFDEAKVLLEDDAIAELAGNAAAQSRRLKLAMICGPHSAMTTGGELSMRKCSTNDAVQVNRLIRLLALATVLTALASPHVPSKSVG